MNIGVGDNYAGNLVPLSVGVAYEENPTISYVPLSGEDFMRRMLSPVSTSEWILLGGPARHPGAVFPLAVRRVNGLRNPLLGDEPSSPEFARFVELFDRLREFLDLLDIEVKPDGSAILLPLRLAVGSSVSAVNLQTSSAWEVLQVFGAGIEIPPAHLEAKIVDPLRTFIGMRLADPGAAQKAPVFTVPMN